MISEDSTVRPATTSDDTHVLFGQTMGLVAITAGMFALGAYLGDGLSSQWSWVGFLAALGCLIGLNFAVQRSEEGGIGLLFAFGLLMGLATAPTIAYYADTNAAAVWQAGAATALFVSGCAVAGFATQRDLAPLGRLLFWALLGLIGFGVVEIFVQIPSGAVVYSIFGLLIFAGLTMIDFQRLKGANDIESAPLLAASIFLDILNVFVFFLNLFRGKN